MDLQSTFYVVAIVSMVMFIVLILASLAFIFYLRRQIAEFQSSVVSRIIDYTRPVDILKGMTSSIIGNILRNFGSR